MALNTHIAQTAVDFQGLGELRRSATKDQHDPETLKQVAGQFEALFVNMMLKSMREAKLADGILDSSQSDTYRDLADQQMSMDLSAQGGIGLQDAIVRQLGGKADNYVRANEKVTSYGMDTVPVRDALQSVANPALLQQALQAAPVSSTSKASNGSNFRFDSPEEFVQKLYPMAKQAADKIGVTPDVILAQAALETGWGKHVINGSNGQSSHNLFNIKADSRWQGDYAATGTLEYRDGVAVKEQAKFRSYDSYQQSFDDYVNFLQTQPRYQDALKQTKDPEKFIEGLHKAGYATDPAYADKIKRIMQSTTVAQFSQQLEYS